MYNDDYTLDDFISQYKGEYEPGDEICIGIEFINNGQWYRMSREPNDNFRYYLIKVTELKEKDKWGYNKQKYDIIAIYDKFVDLLESKHIDNKPFKEMLFSENTEILSRD